MALIYHYTKCISRLFTHIPIDYNNFVRTEWDEQHNKFSRENGERKIERVKKIQRVEHLKIL